MLKYGMCSVALANRAVEDVIEIVRQAGLSAIEWRGIDHVPHGDVATAERVKALTAAAGLTVSSYGSYYRVGISEGGGLTFTDVLASAVALGAPTIRVWAGAQNLADVDSTELQAMVVDTLRIADMAAQAGVTISFEFHADSLTSTNDSTQQFAAMVLHPAVFFSWQVPHGYSIDYNLQGIRALLPRLSTVHVYQWSIMPERAHWAASSDRYDRHPLSDGADQWRQYLTLLRTSERDHYVLIEFVKGDLPQQLINDAQVLKNLL